MPILMQMGCKLNRVRDRVCVNVAAVMVSTATIRMKWNVTNNVFAMAVTFLRDIMV